MKYLNIRVILLLALIAISAYLIFSQITQTRNGAIVTLLSNDSMCGDLKEGDVITKVSNFIVKNDDDFQDAIINFKAGDYATMVVNNGPGGCTAIGDGYFGVNVSDLKSNRLRFGVDIEGGETTTFSTEENVNAQELDKIAEIIENRIGILNLPYFQVSTSGSTIKVSTLKDENINFVTIKGNFEGGVLEYIQIKNNTGEILLGDNQYSFYTENSTVKINNSYYKLGQALSLDGVTYTIKNVTNSSVVIKATVFTNKDVVNVLTRYIFVRYESNLKGYEFNIPVELSKEAVDRYENITKQLTLGRGQPTMENFVVYYIDDKEMSIFSLESFGKTISNDITYVVGLRKSMDAAANDELKAQIALQTDELPTSLKIINIEPFGPTYGNLVINVFIAAMVAITIASFLLVYYVFRNIKFGLYAILLAVSPLIVIVGEISIVQTYFVHGWIIDTQTIVGLAIITCINIVQMLLVAEKLIKNKEISLGYGYKKFIRLSTFIYLLAIVTGLAAMFVFRGAGLTMISGIAIGFLITVPIYKQILKKKSI